MKQMVIALCLLSLAVTSYAQQNKVLLIGIDGCRPDALVAADTPNLDALMANGTYSLDALNTGITISGPGWASLLNGVWPEKHGVTDNSFAGEDFLNYPHLFQRIEEHNPAFNTVSVCQWHPINSQIADGVADLTINVDDHSDYVGNAAIEQLSGSNPDALFLHFDDVDHAGHAYGFSPDVTEYITSIETVDGAIGDVLDALYARPSYADEHWAVIVSTDHGGLGYSHGGNSFEERRIFMIVSGDGIANEEIIAESSTILNPPVFNCLGDASELFFDGSAMAQTSGSELFGFGADQDFTIECRVRTDQSGDVAIMTDKDWDSGFHPGWVFSFNVNGGPWKVNVGDGTNRVDIEGNEISDGEWHMLSATFDRDGMLTIYEDGVMVNETSMAALGDITSQNQIVFAADINQAYNYTGYLSEARVFAELVPPAVINEWACSHLDSTHPSYGYLAAQWAMNEGVGTALSNDGANALVTSLVEHEWQSATDSTWTTVYDYSNTPRQVDFMVSALEHLCVPIQEAWNLDGEILATYCVEGPDGIGDLHINYKLSPNPSEGYITLEVSDELLFQLFTVEGKKVHEANLVIGAQIIDLGHLASGSYLYRLVADDERFSQGKLNVQR